MTSTETKTEMVAAFYATGNWQACRRDRQYEGKMIQLRAVRMSYAVVSQFGTWHHGFATEERAVDFARSMDSQAIVMQVEPYWWCDGWGCAADAAVYPYAADDHTEWKKRGARPWEMGCTHADHVGMRPVAIVPYYNPFRKLA